MATYVTMVTMIALGYYGYWVSEVVIVFSILKAFLDPFSCYRRLCEMKTYRYNLRVVSNGITHIRMLPAVLQLKYSDERTDGRTKGRTDGRTEGCDLPYTYYFYTRGARNS
jgi:hypothetical protein